MRVPYPFFPLPFSFYRCLNIAIWPDSDMSNGSLSLFNGHHIRTYLFSFLQRQGVGKISHCHKILEKREIRLLFLRRSVRPTQWILITVSNKHTEHSTYFMGQNGDKLGLLFISIRRKNLFSICSRPTTSLQTGWWRYWSSRNFVISEGSVLMDFFHRKFCLSWNVDNRYYYRSSI